VTVEVRAVASRGERRLFRDLPARLFGNDPAFVPMLDVAFRAVFDPRNPFWKHAESREWLAWRGGEAGAVGRIGACDDRPLREVAGCGAVGFFEAVEDDDVAVALFRAAGAWLRDRGYVRARGPLSYSIHDTAAVLVEGFATPPTIDTTWNPAYYPRLWEAGGFSGVQDMVALERDGKLTRARGHRFAERARRRGVVIRPLDMRRFAEELTSATKVYNAAWEDNWGHVPITAEEFAFKAKDMKAVLDHGLIRIAECEGRVVGLALALPDLNVAIKKSRGRILPWGWLRLLRAKHCGRARCMLLGVIPGFRRRGIEAALLSEIMAHFDRQYRWAEASWVLADNAEMLNGLKLYDMVPYKRWRMYEKDL
jgi:GNAT superfamily N-acetyltransferase